MLPQKRYSACQRCSRRQAYTKVILDLKSRFRLLYPSSHPWLGDLSPAFVAGTLLTQRIP